MLINLLVPHFGRAVAIRRAYAVSYRRQHILAEALQSAPLGVIVLDLLGEVFWLNRKAEKIVRDCDGLIVRNGAIRLWDFQTEKALGRFITDCIETARHEGLGAGGLLPIPRPSGKLPYHVSVSPLNARSDLLSLPEMGGACLVLIHDPTEPVAISAGNLQVLYGLTLAEATLCVALFEAGSLSAALDVLEMSRNTAKTHLAHVFGKLGVSSQAELLRMLAVGFRKSPDA